MRSVKSEQTAASLAPYIAEKCAELTPVNMDEEQNEDLRRKIYEIDVQFVYKMIRHFRAEAAAKSSK